MADLISVDALRRYMGTVVAGNEDDYLEAIQAAQQYLRNETQRDIRAADTAASARRFRPDSCASRVLRIDDCAEITSVVEDGATLVADSDYIAEPWGVTPSGETMPIEQLRRQCAYWYHDDALLTVTVTAKWGWPSIPPGATLAVKVSAKAYLESKDVRLGLAALTESGGVREREAKAVEDFIEHYSGARSWGIA